jgi:hypothetical protein
VRDGRPSIPPAPPIKRCLPLTNNMGTSRLSPSVKKCLSEKRRTERRLPSWGDPIGRKEEKVGYPESFEQRRSFGQAAPAIGTECDDFEQLRAIGEAVKAARGRRTPNSWLPFSGVSGNDPSLPEFPQFPVPEFPPEFKATEFECPHRGYKSVYERTDLIYQA